jgi:hypothetical protein
MYVLQNPHCLEHLYPQSIREEMALHTNVRSREIFRNDVKSPKYKTGKKIFLRLESEVPIAAENLSRRWTSLPRIDFHDFLNQSFPFSFDCSQFRAVYFYINRTNLTAFHKKQICESRVLGHR